jgi:hypothetical protein
MTDLELYNKAKEAYYNGQPIMEDFEFDELEKRLGLENKSYIGAKKNPTYTVKHPFIMGSLSKVQIKENSEGKIIFSDYVDDINKYLLRNNANWFIVTPKFDGCSFECYVSGEKNNVIFISSRGDGEYGKDLNKHLINKLLPDINKLNKQIPEDYVFRGEVLIDRFIFENKYSEFVNPRSFVSGLLNRDYTPEIEDMINDLSVVIYDIRIMDDHARWVDMDWMGYDYPDKPKFYFTIDKFDSKMLEGLYHKFESYRNEDCPFALDGIVFKPIAGLRENNLTEHRPKDCVAVKFAPQLQETEIVDIKWQLSNKTGEYTPVIIVNPVIMDGKEVTRASAHNYGYILENKISIGTKVILSLAGDIIPFIYKITDTSKYNESNIGLIDINNCIIDGVHLYKKLSEEEIIKNSFLASAEALNIPSIGPSAAETIFEYVKEQCKGDEFFDIPEKPVPNNILFVSGNEIDNALGGKLGTNAKKSFNEYLKKLTLKDIIVSCSFPLYGVKVAEQIEKEMIKSGDGDWTSLPKIAYEWVFDTQNPMYIQVMNIINSIGFDMDQYRIQVEEAKAIRGDQIPIIMTGEPNDYLSKGDFLNKHPEYRNTGSWKEVKIVFTNSLDSNTGKMKKAREKGIEIRLY